MKTTSYCLTLLTLAAGSLLGAVVEITKSVSEADRNKITQAAPAAAPAKPKQARKVLVFSLTKGFRHSSIPHGVVAMEAIGKKSAAFSIEHSEDPKVFAAENLKRFDAVMMLNTTGDLFAEEEYKSALVEFVRSGKGLVGIHSATDTFYGWPEYGQMMGAYFDGHPWHEKVRLKIEDPNHATCKCFNGTHFDKVDEIYQYREKPYARERLRILMSLDPLGTDMKKGGMKRKDGDYAVGWVQKYGDGRVFYCNLGHREDTYWEPTVLAHFLAGIQFAVGDLKADTTPSAALKNKGDVSAPALKRGARLAIVGDSITEQKQYSKFIETYLLACMPHLEVQCLQFGWGGETAPGFANRMENDLVPWNPDVVTTCYGMNDGRYRKYEDTIGKAYEDGMRRIVDRMKKAGATVVVGSPGVVDSQTWAKNDPERDKIYNDNLNQLRQIAHRLADENGFRFADVYGAMMDSMVKSKAALGAAYHVGGGDGVHPAANGHLVMAYAFLKGLGLDGNLGTVTLDWKSGAATAEGGHKVLKATKGSLSLESSRYPFCFSGGEKDPNGTRSILPFSPFNKDLNRFTLVVKGLPEAGAVVKWGDATKSFSGAQLAGGINLAAEFLENPLVGPFNQVMQAVGTKQNFETHMIKGQITKFRSSPKTAEAQAANKALRKKLYDQNDGQHRAAKDSVKPVRHELVITPKGA